VTIAVHRTCALASFGGVIVGCGRKKVPTAELTKARVVIKRAGPYAPFPSIANIPGLHAPVLPNSLSARSVSQSLGPARHAPSQQDAARSIARTHTLTHTQQHARTQARLLLSDRQPSAQCPVVHTLKREQVRTRIRGWGGGGWGVGQRGRRQVSTAPHPDRIPPFPPPPARPPRTRPPALQSFRAGSLLGF
jgi:hypothetical protein